MEAPWERHGSPDGSKHHGSSNGRTMEVPIISRWKHHDYASMEFPMEAWTSPRKHHGSPHGSTVLSWKLHGTTVEVPWKLEAPWKNHGNTNGRMETPWKHHGSPHGSTMGAPWEHYGSTMETMLPWISHGSTMGSIISMDVSMQTLYKHHGSTTGALCYHGRLHEATMDVWRSSPWINMVGPWGLSLGLPWKNSASIGTCNGMG